MENRALNYLSLARKAGKAELGEEPVGAAARAVKAYLIVVAQDASDHTWRRAKSFAAGTEQQVLRLKETKDELGLAIGRQSLAIAAITDASLALAMVKAMEPSEAAAQVKSVLEAKAAKLAKRAQEAKAHQRNVRKGKK